MNTELLNLKDVLDIQKWQTIQDELAQMTDFAIVTIDYKGIVASTHSNCSAFCQKMRSDVKTSRLCQKCDARGGIEAARRNKPYIYLCHANIVDAAIPIIIDNTYIGAVMVGQVLTKDKEKSLHLEKIIQNKSLVNNFESDQTYQELLKLSCEKISTNVNSIYHIISYLVEKTVSKKMIANINQKIFNLSDYTNDKTSDVINVVDQTSSMIIYKNINKNIDKDDDNNLATCKLLEPAIKYIHYNKSEKIEMSQMAKLCHLSVGYFSKLFKKKMGMNCSEYVIKYKINLSKNLLETTEASINEISNSLGFNDCGYFIKLFHKNVGLTPLVYRRNHNKTLLKTLN